MTLFSPSRNELLYQAQKGKCFHCGKLMASITYKKEGQSNGYTVDHIVPVRFGGRRSRQNIVLSCMPCNSRRGCAYPDEEMQQRAKQVNAMARWVKHQTRARAKLGKP